MTDFKKTVRIGTIPQRWDGDGEGRRMSVFCTIRFEDGRLSISGVEGPLASGNALGSCGQIDMHLPEVPALLWNFAEGWDADLLARFLAVWGEWHLNALTPGSPRQMAFLKANPVEVEPGGSHYTKALDALTLAGLSPDADLIHDGKPYVYGSAWLKTEVPAEVIDLLCGLPDADRPSPWRG